MRHFNSNTFVCFIDISGFKNQLKEDVNRATDMIDKFYSARYKVLENHPSLNGVFVSDCGILYPDKGSHEEKLDSILKAVYK